MLGGMASGCPLHNLVPETNDLVIREIGAGILKTEQDPLLPGIYIKGVPCTVRGGMYL